MTKVDPFSLFIDSKKSYVFFSQLHSEGVPLLHFIPKNKENFFFYRNGLSSLIPRLTVKVYTSEEECFELWEKFSYKKTLFQEWDFRYAWYKGYGSKLYFYTVSLGDETVGVLPLWYNEKSQSFEWFGSDWMEDNELMVKQNKVKDILFKIAPSPIHLNSIPYELDLEKRNIFNELELDDPKSYKRIKEFKTIDDWLGTLNKKRRYNLKRDVKRILEMKPQIIVTEENKIENMTMLMEMNKVRFSLESETGKSIFFDERYWNTFKYFVQDVKSAKIKFIKVLIGGKLAAIDMMIEYKNIYHMLIGVNDVEHFSGIGNFMMYVEFEDAIRGKFEMVDCLQEDYGWKHRYFDQMPMMKWSKK